MLFLIEALEAQKGAKIKSQLLYIYLNLCSNGLGEELNKKERLWHQKKERLLQLSPTELKEV